MLVGLRHAANFVALGPFRRCSKMRALSIRQPYVEEILRGIKKIEYRNRPTHIIGERFYIYAGLKVPDAADILRFTTLGWDRESLQRGEDRIVLPIPPGTHWRDAKPLILPGITPEPALPLTLPGGAKVRPRPEQPKISHERKVQIVRSQSKHLKGTPPGKCAVLCPGGKVKFVDRADYVPEPEPEKPKRAPKPRAKNDPKYIAAARELRDRYLEQINTPGERMLPAAHGKYDVSRQLEAAPTQLNQLPLLKAA